MRRSLTVCRSGLSLAAAVVLLTACGGSDGDDTASPETSATTSSSAPETTAEPTETEQTDSEFCTEATAAFQQLEPAFAGGGNDPAALASALQQAAGDLREIDPPSELESDWMALSDGIEQFSQVVSEVDLSDPAGASAAIQERSAEIVGQLTTSATNVQNYLATECGVGTADSTQSAAPTS